ncbi:aspartate aminotransferase family protein [Methylococcus sp. EFPC2]|uniref:aspartate aminotransferase family protein n=1 Tax=Methylococcus sp. EFPC2 TaxID=2812648 RepID=UPI001967FDD0|nr:aspartate aminotransferase family protein [Methylococcus sp. EFPC2]QSA97207.1 aspartate aminotransferase family protein [Methylococcus sp. EFPC2]
MTSHVMPTYARLPVSFARGAGAWLWDEEGKAYLDAVAGVAVCGLGHAHPAVAAAVADQAGKLMHTSNLYRVDLQEKLADELTSASGLDNAFFCNSGAEANEAAIKLARRYGHSRGISEALIVVMQGSFHGRTLATLSATGNPKVQEGFEPLVSGFVRVPYDDADAVAALNNSNIVAVLVEPVQGEGGIRVPADDYLAKLRTLCDQRGWLLMLDEIQTGIGRTGSLFAFQQSGIKPDVLTLAKALGNGVPIGACLARGAAAELLTAGRHGSTFGGNPLACRAALAVLQTVREQNLAERAASLGATLVENFRASLGNNPHLVAIRNKGLMIGIELDRPCGELVGLALDQRLLINVTAERTIRLLPPLILSDEDADLLVRKLSELVLAYLA